MSDTKPTCIKVNENDNVAIVVNGGGLPAGTVFPDGLELLEEVPQGHKAALSDIAEGRAVVRYGETIGYAAADIKKGQWVSEALVREPELSDLAGLPPFSKAPEPLPPLEGYTFEGYRNADGGVGTKNILCITASVQCVAGVLNVALERIRSELLPMYPNVSGVMAFNHGYGCGVAIDAPDAVIPIRTIRNITRNPNLGGQLMVVSLGCEKLPPERLLPGIDRADVLILQEHAGFGAMVDAIVKMAESRLKILNLRRRETCPLSDLTVGLQCGGSDAFSGVTSNPAVGRAADLLVRAGATVMFSEVTEVRDAIHLLTPKAADSGVRDALIREMRWYDSYLEKGGMTRSANPTPGNKKGGLANIVEKALGSVAKAGSSPIAEALAPGERPTRKGLIYAATPASDFVCGTLQLASGITLQVFTTGRGTPYGLAMTPVVKVSSRSELKEQWPDLIDFDAGTVATGERTLDEAGSELFRLIIDAASGRKTVWADEWKLYNDMVLFNPAPIT